MKRKVCKHKLKKQKSKTKEKANIFITQNCDEVNNTHLNNRVRTFYIKIICSVTITR